MTPYPDEQTWWPSVESEMAALYAEAGVPLDWSAFRWSARIAYDIAAGLTAEGSRAKHFAELRAALGLVDPLPPIPARDQVCGVRLSFQGLTVQTAAFGPLPWFEAALTSLSPRDREAVYAAKHWAGDTHCIVGVSWNYAEPGQPYGSGNQVPPCDLSGDLGTYRALVEEAIRAGFVPILMLAGDGRSNPAGGYNDPVGWTYGYEWLLEHLGAIVGALRAGVDLTPYCLFCPGYDGVFYGWGDPPSEPDQQPQRIIEFGRRFRELLPAGHLMLEHDTGHVPVGGGVADYAGPLQTYDVIASEFGRFPCGDQVWQVAARLLGPAYRRPSDQPADDDPSPPFYLAPGTPRGPYFTCGFEWVGLYDWVRGRCDAAQIARERAYLRALGYRYTG